MTTYLDFRGPNFTLEVPSHWQSGATAQVQALFVAPAQDLPLAPSFAVALRPVQAEVTLETLAAQMRTQMPEEYPGFAWQEDATRTLAGQPAVILAYTWRNPDLALEITQRQVLLYQEPYIYILTATLPEGAAAQVAADMQHMETTFTLES